MHIMHTRAFLKSTLLDKCRKNEHFCFMIWQQPIMGSCMDKAETAAVTVKGTKLRNIIELPFGN